MEPDMVLDVVSVVVSAALDAGMSPDAKSLALEIADSGDVALKAVAADGTAFDLVVPAAEIADALGMEGPAPAEDAPAEAPAPAAE